MDITLGFKTDGSAFEPHPRKFCFYFLFKNGPKMGQPDKSYLENTLVRGIFWKEFIKTVIAYSSVPSKNVSCNFLNLKISFEDFELLIKI